MVFEVSAQIMAVHEIHSGEEFRAHATDALCALMDSPCIVTDTFRFDSHKPQHNALVWILGSVVSETTGAMPDTFKPAVPRQPSFHQVTQRPRDQMLTLDTYPKRGVDFEGAGIYRALSENTNTPDTMSIAIRIDLHAALLLTFSRDRPLTLAEVARLAAVQPYFRAAWRNWMSFNHRVAPSTLEPSQLQEAMGLTSRRSEVLTEIIKGQTNFEIGRTLGLTEATVRKHVQLLFRDLGVTSRHAASALALQAVKGERV
ncbi:MAG: LuxR C-terminal-related transcriptional regulator [Planctomycetota bacterium]